MSRAEEKAYSLPAKLSVPMMVCIFPVLFIVILLPVIVRLVTHTGDNHFPFAVFRRRDAPGRREAPADDTDRESESVMFECAQSLTAAGLCHSLQAVEVDKGGFR